MMAGSSGQISLLYRAISSMSASETTWPFQLLGSLGSSMMKLPMSVPSEM